MSWYSGPTLMHTSSTCTSPPTATWSTSGSRGRIVVAQSDDHHDYRGYGGHVARGVLKKGDEVVVLPSGMTSQIQAIDLFDQEVSEAFPPMSVTVRRARCRRLAR